MYLFKIIPPGAKKKQYSVRIFQPPTGCFQNVVNEETSGLCVSSGYLDDFAEQKGIQATYLLQKVSSTPNIILS